MPTLNRVMAGKELWRLIQLYLKAETDIINEIGRLRTLGLVDYHAEAALDRVQAILRKLENDSWEYVPQMIERHFYAKHPEARKPSVRSETAEKHLAGYTNAAALTGEQVDIVQRLTMNLMGQLAEANATAYDTLASALIGRTQPDVFRRVGLEQTAAVQAMGRGVFAAAPGFVEALRREGVTAFVDKAGRHWRLSTYAGMVLRTTSRQAEVLSVLTQAPEWDLYKISKHGTTCKLCAGYEGRVYSKSGKDPDFPPLAAAFGKMDPAGPDDLTNSWLNIHPNCLHQLIRWTPMGRSEAEIQKIKDFSSFKKNPPSVDPRTKKQVEEYRAKERARARYLSDYRQWERYRETIPDDTPKTFETFQKHKYAAKNPETGKLGPDEKFKTWEKDYRRANAVEKSGGSGIIRANALREIPEMIETPMPKPPTKMAVAAKDVTEEYLCSAKPGEGTVTYEDGYTTKGHKDEIKMAEWIHHTFGGDITLLSESAVRGIKMPDYLWYGKNWELKTAHSINGADQSLRHAIKQIQDNPGGVILNILEDMDISKLERQVLGRFLRNNDINVLDVMILSKGKLLEIIRHKK